MEETMNGKQHQLPSEDATDASPLSNNISAAVEDDTTKDVSTAAVDDDSTHSQQQQQQPQPDVDIVAVMIPPDEAAAAAVERAGNNGAVAGGIVGDDGTDAPNGESSTAAVKDDTVEAYRKDDRFALEGFEAEEASFPPTTDTGDEKPEEQPSSSSSLQQQQHPQVALELGSVELEKGATATTLPPLSPSRLSTVSSIGSTMNGDTNTQEDYDGEDDDSYEDGVMAAGVAMDPLVLFGSKCNTNNNNSMNTGNNSILDEINLSHSLMTMNNDEKSIRSESTRPDPPSILDGQSVNDDNNTNNNHDAGGDGAKEWGNVDVQIGIQEVVTELEYYQNQDPEGIVTSLHGASGHLQYDNNDAYYLSEEETAAQALAALSTNVAELTLMQVDEIADPSADSGNQTRRSSHDHATAAWDLDRTAMLAETPKGDTKSSIAATPLETAFLSVPLLLQQQQQQSPEHQDDNDDDAVAQLDYRLVAGPDNLVVLPRVDEHRFYEPPPPQQQQQGSSSSSHPRSAAPHNHPAMQQQQQQSRSFRAQQPQLASSQQQQQQQQLQMPPLHASSFEHLQAQQQQQQQASFGYARSVQQHGPPSMMMGIGSSSGGRRKIRLRLQEEVRNSNSSIKRHFRSGSLLGTLRKSSKRMLRFGGSTRSFDMGDELEPMPELYKTVDRGSIAVSWYEGTSSLELQQHVRKSVVRKLKLENSSVELDDMRLLDESINPPEEVVLSPYMPDGSQFLLRFSTTSARVNDKIKEYDGTMTPLSQYSGRPPVSPSAAPSPHPERDLFSDLNANQLALLNSLKIPMERSGMQRKKKNRLEITKPNNFGSMTGLSDEDKEATHPLLRQEQEEQTTEEAKRSDDDDAVTASNSPYEEDDMMMHSEDPIESRLREITEMLLSDRKRARLRRQERQGEKRQVIFVVANYFVLFLALIAISAELQARVPKWLKMMEVHLQNVQNCSENHEALFECVSRGDFAGLIASVVLWLSRSVATKRIFLFGFDTPKKLWTVVYESLVTSICWGISYLFIRRGMNPDTRPRFVQKYWKDAVYGSLAGFNAAFLKQILKNLIPEEVVEGALRERQLKILGWLPSFD